MAEVLQLSGGRTEIISTEKDFLELVEEMMGNEARSWLAEKFNDLREIEALERQLEDEHDLRHDQMVDIQKALRRARGALALSSGREQEIERELDIIEAIAKEVIKRC